MSVIDYNAMPEDEFRAMLRAFIQAECTPNLMHQARRLRWNEIGPWTRKLAAKGWLAPAWPTRHGGMGLNAEKLLAYHDEFDSAGVARGPDMGVVMIGMLLIKFGTEAQKNHYLPRVLACQDIWCQGYSEPGSGSDLASLRTRAVLDGNEWVINGQKIWTTIAQDASDIFMLVRTDPSAKKQEGISFLLARMDTPGITVRPIRTLAGEDEFCEVFFDNVRVPKDNIVGEMNKGWTMAKALLGFERITLGSPKLAHMALTRLAAIGRELGLMGDESFVHALTRLHLDVEDLTHTYGRFAETLKRGGDLGPEVSILKIGVTETYQKITETMMELAGEPAAVAASHPFGKESVDVLGNFYMSRPGPIYGGSNEIQRNILAKAVLGLPG